MTSTDDDDDVRVPVTYEHCSHVEGPFLHGTVAALEVGDRLVAGHHSHFRPTQALRHVYFTTREETAAWGAEMAVALSTAGDDHATTPRGRVYLVVPEGPFEDDPNVTDRKFPGNPTQSYRTLQPLRVVGELETWERHPQEAVDQMLAGLARLREQGLDVIED